MFTQTKSDGVSCLPLLTYFNVVIVQQRVRKMHVYLDSDRTMAVDKLMRF